MKMSMSISLKAFSAIMLFMICSKVSFSQNRNQETPTMLTLPDSYYKGQEEKRKYVEAQKAASAKTMTLSTSYPSQELSKKESLNPETKAKSLLNTTNIPAGFPSYNSSIMSEKEYESAVYQWFKANPSYRKSK